MGPAFLNACTSFRIAWQLRIELAFVTRPDTASDLIPKLCDQGDRRQMLYLNIESSFDVLLAGIAYSSGLLMY